MDGATGERTHVLIRSQHPQPAAMLVGAPNQYAIASVFVYGWQKWQKINHLQSVLAHGEREREAMRWQCEVPSDGCILKMQIATTRLRDALLLPSRRLERPAGFCIVTGWVCRMREIGSLLHVRNYFSWEWYYAKDLPEKLAVETFPKLFFIGEVYQGFHSEISMNAFKQYM